MWKVGVSRAAMPVHKMDLLGREKTDGWVHPCGLHAGSGYNITVKTPIKDTLGTSHFVLCKEVTITTFNFSFVWKFGLFRSVLIRVFTVYCSKGCNI